MNLLILLISLPKETLYTSVGKSTTKGTEEIEQGQATLICVFLSQFLID